MDQKQIEKDNTDIEIDLLELFKYLKKRLWKIILVTVIFGLIAGVYTHFCISKMYASRATVFVEPKVTDSTYSYSDLSANNYMIQNYVVMLQGNNIQTKVANNLDIKVGVVSSSLSISVINNSQIISITATTVDPSLSKKIVDETVDVFIEEMKTNFSITNISIADKAVKAKDPVSPNLKKNVAIGAIIGLVLMCAIYIIRFLMDFHIHSKEEAEKYFDLPNFGSIPYME